MRRLVLLLTAIAAVAGTLALGLPAFAGSSVPAGTITACVTPSRTFSHVYTNSTTKPNCTSGSWRANIASEAQLQATNGHVATNTSDIAALKGQEVTGGTDLLGRVASVTTGGSFNGSASSSNPVGTVRLKAGTYLLSLNAKATPPSGGTGAVQVFPQFFVYNGAFSATNTPWWSNDLFNVGSGALESGANANIDSYYSGSTVLTLSSDTTLYVYAFGYDSDRGAGSYALDDLSVSATRINPAAWLPPGAAG